MLSIVWSLLPDNDWWALPVFLCKLNPIKVHWGTGSWPFSFERSATFPPQADHVFIDLFLSMVADRGRGLCGWNPPTHNYCRVKWDMIKIFHPKSFKSLIVVWISVSLPEDTEVLMNLLLEVGRQSVSTQLFYQNSLYFLLGQDNSVEIPSCWEHQFQLHTHDKGNNCRVIWHSAKVDLIQSPIYHLTQPEFNKLKVVWIFSLTRYSMVGARAHLGKTRENMHRTYFWPCCRVNPCPPLP